MTTIRSTRAAGAAVLTAAVAITPAMAGASPPHPEETGHGYYVYADVVEVSPRYGWHEVSEPVTQCVEAVQPADYRRDWRRDHTRHRYERDRRYRHDRHDRGGDAAAGLVGGLIGGLIGNQFGGGNGKKALTVAGALIGASVARDHVRGHDDHVSRYPHYQSDRHFYGTRHCTEIERTRRVRGVNGYDVTYRYQGATFHKWVDEHPGDAIRVHVAVEPVQ